QAEDGIRDFHVTGVQTCALPILAKRREIRQAIKAQQAGDKTFSECATAYIEAKAPEWKNPKHRQQWENTLSQYAYPVMGSLAVRSEECRVGEVTSIVRSQRRIVA